MARIYHFVPLPTGPFTGLDLVARCAFGLIYDRWQLSRKNGFKDEHGVFCFYEREQLARDLGVTLPTIRSAIARLELNKLILTRRERIGDPMRYYLSDSAELYFDDITEWNVLY